MIYETDFVDIVTQRSILACTGRNIVCTVMFVLFLLTCVVESMYAILHP